MPLKSAMPALCVLLVFSCTTKLKEAPLFTHHIRDGQLELFMGNQEVLTYHFKTAYPPVGVDSAYQRSAFIHPLQTPNGKTLTRIQPEDHYHHYGIWNPWTHTLYDKDTLDFWNLVKKEATVRFAKFDTIMDNGYKVLHEHVVLKADKNEIALNEWQTIELQTGTDSTNYRVNLKFDYKCATEKPFKILEYRYGGLGWRATEEWNNQNSEVLTSEGKTRSDADGSLARWLIVQGILGNGTGGVLMLSHPDNFNHPEPLRIWPEDVYDRGDMFACFFPTKYSDWLLEPGNIYSLKYQLVVFDGLLDADKAETFWQEFANK
ncbi:MULTISPECIES: PmoA family protein [Flavobacteriaceae]|uniref:DUF6807 domain-containing protein n=1 Tax=Flavobacteriaceae TaxID=49546 RepID=UPI00149286EE|nr:MULTISPECIES: PmoA family protein [Allomuricauda]MDC6364715.1 PmoA family protein [Muricauda sp. AC10]